MAQPTQPETEAVNADSFLDIVASIVSIMIIMVLMTGLKIKHSPVDLLSAAEGGPPSENLTAELADEQAVRGDVFRVAEEIQKVQQETAVRGRERDLLALAVKSVEQKVEGERQELQEQTGQDAGLASQLDTARRRLDDLQRRRTAIETAPAAPVQIECYPTPLSRTVEGHEIHFQLSGSRIAHIPLDALILRFKSEAEHKAHKLADMPELTDTVGPEGGFRMRYTLERHEVTAEENRQTGRAGVFVRLKRWTLIPTADDLGETVDEALAEGSQFRLVLSDRRSRDAAVTLWTYPDSFDAFRRLKKELYRLGFPVAARPLPEGTPISGSPDGSKSSAE